MTLWHETRSRRRAWALQHPNDLSAVLQRAKQRRCARVIVTAGSAPESVEVLDLIDGLRKDACSLHYPLLYSTVGVHPTRSKQWNGNDAHMQRYFDSLMAAIKRGLESSPRTVVAIGECGLDYDRLHFSDKASQLRHFAKHFDLVERVKQLYGVSLPLFLHDRNTGGEFAAIMKENRHRFDHGVVHSFTGTEEDLKRHLELDLYIGINGCSLKTAANLSVLKLVPLDRLLLETDAPWCSVSSSHAGSSLVGSRVVQASKPEQWSADLQGVKGRNEPGFMVQVLEVVAATLGVSGIQLAEQVRVNTMRVFFPEEIKKEAAHERKE